MELTSDNVSGWRGLIKLRTAKYSYILGPIREASRVLKSVTPFDSCVNLKSPFSVFCKLHSKSMHAHGRVEKSEYLEDNPNSFLPLFFP